MVASFYQFDCLQSAENLSATNRAEPIGSFCSRLACGAMSASVGSFCSKNRDNECDDAPCSDDRARC